MPYTPRSDLDSPLYIRLDRLCFVLLGAQARVKLHRENLPKHGRFCCHPAFLKSAHSAGLLPGSGRGLALPLDGG